MKFFGLSDYVYVMIVVVININKFEVVICYF